MIYNREEKRDAYNHPISVSNLGKLEFHPRYYYSHMTSPKNKETTAFLVGGALDVLITDGPKEFAKKYLVMDSQQPSGMLATLVECVVEYETQESEDFTLSLEEKIELCFDQIDWKKGLSNAITEFKKPKYMQYYKYLQAKQSKEKEVLTTEQYELVKGMFNALKYDKYTSFWLTEVPKSDDWDVEYQVRLEFPYTPLGDKESVTCKGFIDMLYINHKERKIYIMDLKTTSSDDFKDSFLKYGYHRQAALYTCGVQDLIDNSPDWAHLKGYTIENFMFMVAKKGKYPNPTIYQCTDMDLRAGQYGGVDKQGKFHKGFDNLISDVLFHQRHKDWNYCREYIENGGKNMLDVF